MKSLLFTLSLIVPCALFSQGDSFGHKPFAEYSVDFEKGLILSKDSEAYTLPFDVPFILTGSVSNSVTSVKLLVYEKSDEKSINEAGYALDAVPIEKRFADTRFIADIKKLAANKYSIQYHEWKGTEAINLISGKALDTAKAGKKLFYMTCSPLQAFTEYSFVFIIERHRTEGEQLALFKSYVLPILRSSIIGERELKEADVNAMLSGSSEFNSGLYQLVSEKEERLNSNENSTELHNQIERLQGKYNEYSKRVGVGEYAYFKNTTLEILRNSRVFSPDSIFHEVPDSILTKIEALYPGLKAGIRHFALMSNDTKRFQGVLKGYLLFDGSDDLNKAINNSNDIESAFIINEDLQEKVIQRYRVVYDTLEYFSRALKELYYMNLLGSKPKSMKPWNQLDFLSSRVGALKSDVEMIHELYKKTVQEARRLSYEKSRKQTFQLQSNSLSSQSYTTRANWYLLPDIGVAGFGTPGSGLQFTSHLGVNLHFTAINREANYSVFKQCNRPRYFWKNFSLYLGVTTNWFQPSDNQFLVQTETLKITHLWKNNSLMTGVGMRFYEGFRFSAGAIWARQQDLRGLNNINRTVPLFYSSLTLDIDLRSIIQKSVGVFKDISK